MAMAMFSLKGRTRHALTMKNAWCGAGSLGGVGASWLGEGGPLLVGVLLLN